MANIAYCWHQFRVELDYGGAGYSLGAVTCRAELEGDIDAPEPTLKCLLAVGRKARNGRVYDDYTILNPMTSDQLFTAIYGRAMVRLTSEPERSEMLATWRRAVMAQRERIARYDRQHPPVSA